MRVSFNLETISMSPAARLIDSKFFFVNRFSTNRDDVGQSFYAYSISPAIFGESQSSNFEGVQVFSYLRREGLSS